MDWDQEYYDDDDDGATFDGPPRDAERFWDDDFENDYLYEEGESAFAPPAFPLRVVSALRVRTMRLRALWRHHVLDRIRRCETCGATVRDCQCIPF